jgi:predicted hydrocarbon binding protein
MFEAFKKLMFARQVDFEEGKIAFLGYPVIITPVTTIADYMRVLRRELGRKRADDLMYEAMKDTAIKYLNHLQKHFSMSKVDMIKWAANTLGLAGWGRCTVISANAEEKKAVIRMYDSTVAKIVGKDTNPTDIILAGFFAGGESAVFGSNVEVKEVKCIAKGDPYCEFITI